MQVEPARILATEVGTSAEREKNNCGEENCEKVMLMFKES